MESTADPALPVGVRVFSLTTHSDPRGGFTEVFRSSWGTGIDPVQWNVVSSAAGVLRGVHVHVVHDDYFMALAGRVLVGVQDLRRGSPTEGVAGVIELSGGPLRAVRIPRGVAHGFFFKEQSLHLYAVSHYWNTADELGCHWNSPGLSIPWQVDAPVLSPRDEAAGSLEMLLSQLASFLAPIHEQVLADLGLQPWPDIRTSQDPENIFRSSFCATIVGLRKRRH